MTTEEINYRRFFDINELAAIRVEVPEVFKATHRLVFHVLGQQEATGLRIDHPDGLWDPPAYFRRLQESYLLHCLGASGGASSVSQEDLTKTVGHWLDQQGALPCGERAWPLYVAAEKILSEDEALPTDWAVCGTTGYDFLAEVNRLLTDSSQACQFDRIYGQFTAARADFKKLANSCKKMIRLVAMAGEINALAHLLDRISEKNRRYRDFTLNSLTHGIREVIACLPVYRTYVNLLNGPSQRDEETIETAVAEARRQNPRTAHEIFDFIRDTLLLRNVEDFRPEDRPGLIEFVMKFQQLTGAVMAKGVGDTAFYIYNRLVSLNEVGGRPGQFGADVEAFHRSNSERLKNWPHSMLATSTHDTKRSEDVRARIQVLSEIPKEWQAGLTRWSRLNAYDFEAQIEPNLDAVQEFRLITNGFDAEYGRFSGALMNTITKSGTNSFHGTVFEFLRNDAMDARGFFDTGKGALKKNQFGYAVGGPAIKDKLFWFTDYQGTRRVDGGSASEVQVLSQAERQGRVRVGWRSPN